MKPFNRKRIGLSASLFVLGGMICMSPMASAFTTEVTTVEQLTEAILTANLTEGEDTLLLTPGSHYPVLTAYADQTAFPTITGPLRIEGSGATLERVNIGEPLRFFEVAPEGTLVISNLTLRGGEADAGGAIKIHGAVDLRYCTLIGNRAGGDGGAIYLESMADDPRAQASLTGCAVTGNQSLNGSGGAIYNLRGYLEVAQSTVAGNSAAIHGGAVYAYDAETHVYAATLAGNRAGQMGGGSYSTGPAVLTIVNSTLSGNEAGSMGGALASNSHATSALTSCSLIDNRAPTGGSIAVTNAATLLLNGTLIANPPAPAAECYTGSGTGEGVIVSKGVNLATDTTCSVEYVGHEMLKLGPLTGNGGPTMTHALLEGSVALDAIAPVDAYGLPGVDQRGTIRPQDADGDGNNFIDVGAVEGESVLRIDVQPKDLLNVIRLSQKTFDVLVKPTAAFDTDALTAMDTAAMNIQFGPTWIAPTGDFTRGNKLATHQVDEGLLLHFVTKDTGLTVNDHQGCLLVVMDGGRLFRGCDMISVRR